MPSRIPSGSPRGGLSLSSNATVRAPISTTASRRAVSKNPMATTTDNSLAASDLKKSQTLLIAALGVVYGDIGTSPLYAIRQSLIQFGETTNESILGVLSLIAWSLFLVVTVKYVFVIMRADNRGEGGLLALTALALRTTRDSVRRSFWIMGAGLVGAALFYGDGVI